ncbi:ABC transporter ATP-binding protein [Microtetraspora sp. NBRC 16547]|uniref:ABC transporter ATP-binding protein n=1 Tax=Microtetraspora sp. NBRC 16547 TaxID=3030993 RepID=UPI0024A2D408|nr:ABC transporter ATP-binding protein [Microtetraspora sp. NBRC 16547]GLW98240.1 polyamine-transporting ATPase [Microtetraspora sp. NBRC 16547]
MTRTANDKGGAAVHLTELTKRYGNAPAAVDAVNLEIAAGEFMTLLGPSGSGKTTTLSMIAGFTRATSGRIEVGGHDVAGLPPYKRDLGVVFQHYALFPHMTAAQNIAFPLKQRKVGKAEIATRVADALDLVHLGGMGDRLPRQLSGGQQQRVALARAVVFSPRVLLMDEPLGALDKKLREQLQGEIARMHRDLGITFVFVTHDQEEALALSDRIAVFNEGRIEQVGTAADLYERPETLFVARFLGESNVLTGTMTDPSTLEGRGFRVAVPRAGVSGGPSGPTSRTASVVIRPERLTVLPGDAQVPAGHNALRGTVSGLTYLGAHSTVTVELDCGELATVREPAAARSEISAGAPVQLTWPIEHGVLVSS